MPLPSLFESALQVAPDAILLVDAAGHIVFANTAAEVLFGYEGAQLAGEPVERLMPQPLRTLHEKLRTDFQQAPRTRPMGQGFDLRALRSDGTEVPVEIALSPVQQAGRRLVIAAIRDVSERKRIEVQLGREREAAERAGASAGEARDLAERASAAKSRFLATASHDLRQPLQTLALLNGTLRRLSREPEARAALDRQEQAIGAMSRLVNALLDIGKLESGAVRPQIGEVALSPLLEPLQQEFSALAEQKGLTLRMDFDDGVLRTDVALLEQVLRNLLSNALKYTVRGEILLRCVIEPPLAHFEVRDSGIGIAPQQLALVFNEFYQIDTSAAVPRSGYGLGLSIVSRIVTLLGLKLKVQSALGVGTRFMLTVPAGSAPPAERAEGDLTPEEPVHFASAPRILLIEDEQSVRSATELLLRASGYEVIAGSGADEALEALERHSDIDLLISDAHLAGAISGPQVIAAVRDRLGARLPVILLSGDTTLCEETPVREAFSRTARKPLRAEELLGLIGELLGGS